MKKMILIDGNSLLFRAYYATAYSGNLMKSSKGLHTNAIFGFANMMNSLVDNNEFSHILVAFDAGKTTFRHKDYKEYKGGRKPTPNELLEQMPVARQLLDALNIKCYELENYEADDIIGTMSKMAEEQGFDEVEIITGDKDLLQLVSDKTHVNITKKGLSDIETYTIKYLKEKMGVTPDQVTDLKGLMGDSSDNIPGIKGVGEKTALKLLNKYKTVENIVENAEEIKGKLGEKVVAGKDIARLSKQLATIKKDTPIEISIEDLEHKKFDYETLKEFYEYLDFHSFIKRLAVNTDDKEEVEIKYEIVRDPNKVGNILVNGSFVIVETFGTNYHKADILGMGIVNKLGKFYIPNEVLETNQNVQDFLSNSEIDKYTFDFKRAKVALKWHGYDFEGVSFDLLTAAYVLNPSIAKEDLRVIASNFSYDDVSYDEEIYGKGAKYLVPEEEILSAHVVKKATALRQLKPILIDKLREYDQEDLYFDLEFPLVTVLAEMEYTGIDVDRTRLDDIGEELLTRITKLEKDIHELAGKSFNIGSPKQLGVVLFEDLGLKVIKKTKTGYSTNADVLEKLKEKHPIIEKVLEYRTITKLHSTYIEGLKDAIFEDGKIHTIFNQTLTSTGRLSSTEPNLQNIPIRYEEGRNIRKAFVASSEDGVILAADYSQIELRILAHMSGAENLMEAFIHDMDIHTKTAMDVFGVKHEEVTSLMRRQAKAVNFGIVYGISAFGLSENLNISQKEAQKFIDKYLETYPGIKEYMDDIVAKAKLNGYAETMLKRRRYIPELTNKNYMRRQFGERTAMNAPIQGSAADIIKIAMVNVFNRISKEELNTKLLIQVHDELILDVPKEELEQVKTLVKEEMENAFKLNVPLKVDMDYGKSWYEAK
ncbi:DNA polymerase I [Haloplasma contractile]|uniref:DNA polymerase I n=1 Tax=Haloplasma contractile SSD-17B TaxID=1033810 RepID=U2FJW2_9MOLU|nr:DNA polymerase I [Haloplasma contractile]ERJ11519.1 DNA polymerase protein [Haloplasma contractile SSD-17B]